MPAIPVPSDPLYKGPVGIRLATERDIPEVLIAYQDDRGLAGALGLARAPSGAQLGRAMEDAPAWLQAGHAITLTIVEDGCDECRGQVHADRFDWEHAHAELTVWVAPAARGRGLGSAALALAAEWLLEAAGLVRVHVLLAPSGEAALRTALAAGFSREGVLRARAREVEGRRSDRIVLSRLASDPPATIMRP